MEGVSTPSHPNVIHLGADMLRCDVRPNQADSTFHGEGEFEVHVV